MIKRMWMDSMTDKKKKITKILLYGAGNYCNLYLSKMRRKDDIVVAVIDGSINKWGEKINSYVIKSPDIITEIQYDKLVITVERYESIVDYLLDKGINKNDIYIYNGNKNILFSLISVYDQYLENKIFKKRAIKQIKMGLLMESFREAEYCGYERVIVVGDKEDYFVVSEFFDEISPNKLIIYSENISDLQIEEKDKIIICGGNYKKDLESIRKIIKSDRQWILLPLFDVKNLVYL